MRIEQALQKRSEIRGLSVSIESTRLLSHLCYPSEDFAVTMLVEGLELELFPVRGEKGLEWRGIRLRRGKADGVQSCDFWAMVS
jgi:hypothetical protein